MGTLCTATALASEVSLPRLALSPHRSHDHDIVQARGGFGGGGGGLRCGRHLQQGRWREGGGVVDGAAGGATLPWARHALHADTPTHPPSEPSLDVP